MSIGNLRDQGNKGTNYPFQLAVLKMLEQINGSITALPGVDYETRTTTYQATATVGGQYSSGNIIVRYDIIDVATSTLAATVWYNQTLQTTILPPLPANLTPITAPSGVTVLNGPLGAAVNIQDGGNSITVDGGTGVTRTPTLLRTSGSGTIAAGAYSMSFASVGTANATVGGMTLKPGETINFDAGAINNTLAAVTYNATTAGAELIIITLT